MVILHRPIESNAMVSNLNPFHSADSQQPEYNQDMLPLDRQNHWRELYRRDHPGWRPSTEVFAELVRENIKPRDFILDLGCGRGGLVEQLDFDTPIIMGADPDIRSLREHRVPALPRVVATSERLPFVDGSFDLIYAAWLLEHVANPDRTWSEIHRLLKPDGVFIFLTPNVRHPLIWLNLVVGRFAFVQGRLVSRLYNRAETDTFPTTYRSNSPETTHALALAAGLRMEKLMLIPDPTYLAFSSLLYRLATGIDDRLPGDRHIHLAGVARRV
jgi:SAM-dependent methyltransferase